MLALGARQTKPEKKRVTLVELLLARARFFEKTRLILRLGD